MRRPITVWLIVVVAAMGLITLVSRASSYPDKYRETYRAAFSKLDGEPRASKGKGEQMTMCNHKLEFDLENMSMEQISAATVLAEQGPMIKATIETLFGKQIARCFHDLVVIANKAAEADDEDYDDGAERLSTIGNLFGSIFGQNIGNTIDDATHAIQTGIENLAPQGVGDLTKGVASIGNGIVGTIAGAAGLKDKRKQQAEEQKAKKPAAAAADKPKSGPVPSGSDKSETKLAASAKATTGDVSKLSLVSDSPKKKSPSVLSKRRKVPKRDQDDEDSDAEKDDDYDDE